MDKQYGFQDIIKKSVLNLDAFQTISPISVMQCLFFTLLVALFIFYVYKLTFRGVVYSQTFNITLVPMCLLTSIIILTISSNVVLSLGMVGALSIVRFRTALKDPMDIVFMFWAICAGIASGAGVYSVSIIGSLFTGIVLIVMTRFKVKGKSYMLIIQYEEEANDNVKKILSKIKYELKSKTVTQGTVELTVEVKLKGDNTAFVTQLADTEGVLHASLVSYNGDYAA